MDIPELGRENEIWARFLSIAWSKLRLCSANHRAGYFSNLACDWLSTVWAYSEQETENGPWNGWRELASELYFASVVASITVLCMSPWNPFYYG